VALAAAGPNTDGCGALSADDRREGGVVPHAVSRSLGCLSGPLGRQHASKTEVRIIDFVDTGHPALLRMWDKRQRGYRAMGYRVGSGAPTVGSFEW